MNPPAPKVLALADTAFDEATGWRKGQHLIDALPYIDTPTPELRKQVDELIAEEMKRSTKRPQDYLKELPTAGPIFPNNPMLAAEYDRVKQQLPMPPLDAVRFRLEPPPLSRRNDYNAWRSTVDNAHAQLEHQYLRIVNLEIMLKYGANNWRAQNQLTEVTNKQLEAELQQLKSSSEQINKERKLQQMDVGQKLADLEHQWMELLYKNIAIEKACSQLERQVADMQAQLDARQKAAAAANGPADAAHANGAADSGQGVQQGQEQQQEAAANGAPEGSGPTQAAVNAAAAEEMEQ